MELEKDVAGASMHPIVPQPYQSYQCILIDPPWPQVMSGKYKSSKNKRADDLPYPAMSLEEMLRLPVKALGADDSHLWLWTTNQFLEDGFILMRAWGFKYLAAIHAIKPSGIGNYFVHRTQTLLFGYKTKCKFPLGRYKPNIIEVPDPKRHSEKWDETYEYIESVSPGPRLELFARRKRPGWDVWGNEVKPDIDLNAMPPVSEASRHDGCKHIVIEDEDGEAVCGLCGKDFGWYCHISPTSVCDYYDTEFCMYCGAPEERQ
jgi:N6-adenosine-specific RNA methylase IME4